jgi:2-polyprenyl-3-methyl-5-hydroxy-6-metoxy-1,4-benzoquinol methylase
MYETIKPWCTGSVLEIGSGLGNISEFFLNDKASLFLSDIREGYCRTLEERFSGYPALAGVRLIDLADPEFETRYPELIGRFDSVFALNVVEHIFNDRLALENCHKLLKSGGRVVILVPAFQTLYNAFDRELEHYRRYTRKSLIALFQSSGFKIAHSQYFNAAGIAGWFVSGKIQHHKIIPDGQIRLFNKLVFLFRLFDKMIFNSFGLSVIAVGVKP